MTQEPPMDQNMGGGEQIPPMDNNIPPADNGESPEIQQLINLLNANPDKVEGIMNYAKGVIGDEPNSGGGKMPPMDGMQESKKYNIDEIVDEIMTGNRNIKTNINKPQPQVSMKDKLFKPNF